MTLRAVPLGSQGLRVSEIGYGAWGLSGDYGAADDEESAATIRRALDLGSTFLDTADGYGAGHNERLVGTAIRGRRDEVVLATKAGLVRGADGSFGVCGRPEYVKEAAGESLRRLGVDHVDLLYLHRADPGVPIEETWGAMTELVTAGTARFLGLCEVPAELVHRAHAVHPVTCVQSEYSLWTREPEVELLPALAELGVGFVAFSPLGRGFLTGAFTQPEKLEPGDFRRRLPRFAGESLARNVQLLPALERIAVDRDVTPGEVALAWLLARGVVPIPGTRRRGHLETNVRAAALRLGEAERRALDDAFPVGAASGDRYPPELGALRPEPAAG